MTRTEAGQLSPRALRSLIEHGDGRDRAFADAILRMAWSRTLDPAQRLELDLLHASVRGAALRHHASLRARIATGELRRAALRQLFDEQPPLERDHFVEEVLGIAYPPLRESSPSSDFMSYAPSGYDEIVHAFDASELGSGERFLDLGAGLGKVVMLAALLTDARSVGVESDGVLCELGDMARRELGVGGAQLRCGDARHAPTLDADVVFMYLPFSGAVMESVMQKLLGDARRSPTGKFFLCTGALDLQRYPELTPAAPAKSWLNVYARSRP